MNLLRTAFRPLSSTAFLLIALTATARLTAASYYIDYAGGLDAYDGASTATAWQHCPGDPAATGSAATTTVRAGDTVYFKGGVTYVLTGATGIQLGSSGAAGAPITFDGNSGGTWGTGRAKLTDNYGASSVAAFFSNSPVSYVTFSSLDIGAIGGTAMLPLDPGAAVPARYGAGLVFNGGLSNATIVGCVFHDLGYSYNQKPMSAASIAGAGIALGSCNTVTISNCDFSHMATAIELRTATAVANLTVTSCTFHDSVGWTIDLPPPPTAASNFQLSGCVESNNAQLSASSWMGYGPSPRTDVQTVMAGASVTFNATAAASPSATFQWRKNGTALLGATGSTFTIASVTTSDAGNYSVTATNSSGSTTSDDAILNVQAPSGSVAPVITTQPTSVTAAPLSTTSFTVAASGTPAPTYQWLKDGVAIAGWTNATLTIAGVTTNDIATYTAIATNSAGSASSNAATLTVSSTATTSGGATSGTTTSTTTTTNAGATSPAITTQPLSQIAAPLSTATFTVAASGSPTPTYQWLKNGVAIPGWTNATLTLQGITTNDVATYVAVATNSAGAVNSDPATLTVSSTSTSGGTTSGGTTTGTVTTAPTVPTITTQPATAQTVNAGATVAFTVGASGSPAPTFQWQKNGVAISGATAATLTLNAVTAADAATYTAVAANSAGSAVSNGAVLTVNTPPTITTQPTSQTAALKSTATFTVAAIGSPSPTYQWSKDGTPISGATTSSFTVRNISKGSAGTYTATATNVAGTVTSNGATLTIDSSTKPARLVVATSASLGDLAITTQPANENVEAGATATFNVAATSTTPLHYQWTKDDAPIGGATDTTLTVPLARTVDAGTYAVIVNDSYGSLTSDAAMLVVAPGDNRESRLSNLSVRAVAGTGSNTLIAGFVVSGGATKSLLVRGVGPTLADYGVDGALANPTLSLYSGSNLIGTNAGWTTSGEAPHLASVAKDVGAFSLPAASRDAAIAPMLATGSYTAQISSVDGTSGVALVELYDASLDSTTRLANVSVRATVGTGSAAPIIGFVVNGTKPKQLLIRAIGPGLAKYGVDGTLADPRLTIYHDAVAVAGNDDWNGDPALAAAFDRVGAFPIDDVHSKDAAIVFSASPGAYSAVVTGADNAAGVVIVEVYELP